MSDIINKYIPNYDFCEPIPYKGLMLRPFTVRNIRNSQYALYCLSVDPYEFDDLKLLPLKRLDFILTILNRIKENRLPTEKKIADKYELVEASFKNLLGYLFPEYDIYFGDYSNPKRKKALSFIKNDSTYIIISMNEFEELSDLVLYQNAVDVSYKTVPLGLRKDIQRRKSIKKTQEVNIEKLIDIVAHKFTDITYESTKSMPLRKFYNQIDNIRNEQEYEILTNPMYKAENLKHWMYGEYDRDTYKKHIQREDEARKEIDQIKQ